VELTASKQGFRSDGGHVSDSEACLQRCAVDLVCHANLLALDTSKSLRAVVAFLISQLAELEVGTAHRDPLELNSTDTVIYTSGDLLLDSQPLAARRGDELRDKAIA
jgi:hypothetical protein